MLRLNIENKDGALIQKLCRLLTYPNPKYQDAKRLGFSTHGILPEIKNYEISSDGTVLTTTRGEINKVRAIFPEEETTDQAIRRVFSFIRYKNNDFELDERQTRAVKAVLKKKQGIIHAATSAGKSAIIMAMIGERKVRTIVVVHRKVLLEQLIADARKWLKGTTIGQIGAGKIETDALVTFAIDKSLHSLLKRQPDLKSYWEMLIQDEVHLSPSTTFQSIINKLDTPYRYGLTGTLKRKDRMEFLIYATYGNVIATITKDELLEADRVSPVEVEIVESEAEVDPAFFDLPTTKRWQAIDKALHEDEERSWDIAEKAAELAGESSGRRVVVLSRYVEPCYNVGAMIASLNSVVPHFVTGEEKDPGLACKKFERGESSQIMCATIGCFSTGVNIPNLTDIILISPIFNNELLIHQIRGRLMRKSKGKTHGTLHFVWDPYVFPSHNLNRFKAIMKK